LQQEYSICNIDRQITICNIYLPDSIVFSYQQIINIIKQLPTPFITVGEFNSRITNWECNHTDHRGKIIEKIIDDENITLLNNEAFTRHNSSKRTFSAIDLSLASLSISPYLSWEVKTNYFNSDHWPISIKIHHRNNPQTSYNTNKWSLKDPNWTLYSDIIDKTMSNYLMAHKSIGKTIMHPKKIPVSWWSKEYNDTIKKTIKKHSTDIKKSKQPWTK